MGRRAVGSVSLGALNMTRVVSVLFGLTSFIPSYQFLPQLFAQTSNVASVPEVSAPTPPIKASKVNWSFKTVSDAIRDILVGPACPAWPTCGAGSGITSLSGFKTFVAESAFSSGIYVENTGFGAFVLTSNSVMP